MVAVLIAAVFIQGCFCVFIRDVFVRLFGTVFY